MARCLRRSHSASIGENFLRALDRVPERFAPVFVEKEAVASVGRWIVIDDDLLDPAGRAGDREHAIFQAVHRAESARLNPGGDERNVASTFDQMCASASS